MGSIHDRKRGSGFYFYLIGKAHLEVGGARIDIAGIAVQYEGEMTLISHSSGDRVHRENSHFRESASLAARGTVTSSVVGTAFALVELLASLRLAARVLALFPVASGQELRRARKSSPAAQTQARLVCNEAEYWHSE